MNKNNDREKYTIINLIMGVWYVAYNLELTKKMLSIENF